MFVESKISADVVLGASVPFADVGNAGANFGFEVPENKNVIEIYVEGTVAVATLGERVDFDVLLQKDGGTAKRISSGEVGAGTEKAAGLGGVQGVVAAALMQLRIAKTLNITKGLYKLKLQYKTTAGAATIHGATHDLRIGVRFHRHIAKLAQGQKPQNQIQV